MPNTTNFNWATPADSDLVKDGAAAIRTLGNSIDASFVDLKGGTTGQVLSKNSNTDLDFTWVAQDDSNAIQNTIVDAKGDLISATAADTPARLASSGVNGDVLTIDTSTSTGLKWVTPAAGGGMTLLSTTTLSGASTTISNISQDYVDLFIQIYAVENASQAYPNIQFMNGTTTQNLRYAVERSTGTTGNYINYAEMWLTDVDGISANNPNNGFGIHLTNYKDAVAFARNFYGQGTAFIGSTVAFSYWGNCYGTSAINAVKISTSTGTFTGGTVKIWGIK